MKDLFELADQVRDERTFLIFLAALAADRANEVKQENPNSPFEPGPNGWRNGSIEDFLAAAHAWAIDGGPEKVESPGTAWSRCARILLMGKEYE